MTFEITRPLPGASFGGIMSLAGGGGARAVIAAAAAAPRTLPEALGECGGLLLLRGLHDIAAAQ